MILEQIATAGDRNFGYLLADHDGGSAAIIDPSGAPGKFMVRLDALKLTLRWIICTHGHYDHTDGAKDLQLRYGTPIAMHAETAFEREAPLADGQRLPVGDLVLSVLHTPGHTGDSICLYADGAVFTGDTLFVGKVGGTDFGAGAEAQYRSLHDKLVRLPADTLVYPGHDVGVRPVSTIRDELTQNPFLLQPDLEHFIELKRNWLKYKVQHGIK